MSKITKYVRSLWHPQLALFCLILWIAIIGLWIWVDRAYPHARYEYVGTGEYADGSMDRATGEILQKVAVYVPNNPWYVNALRRWSPFAVTALGFGNLLLWFEYHHSTSPRTPDNLRQPWLLRAEEPPPDEPME